MKLPYAVIAMVVLSGTAIIGRPAPVEGCEECSFESGEANCLAGCPLYNLDCDGLVGCQEINSGSCSGTDGCKPLGAMLLDGNVSVGGVLAAGMVADEDELNDGFARFEDSSGVLYRRTCDAAIAKREFDAKAIRDMRVRSAEITL